MRPQSFLILTLFLFSFSNVLWVSNSEPLTSSIYDVLRSHGLPMGLLPKGIKEFSFDGNGRFEIHLDRACNAKFENELHYDQNVTGNLTYGQIGGLSGIVAQDLFLWFPVKEIRVDVPSSGLIYFDVGVVSKQFSLSSFDTPQDCFAVQPSDRHDGMFIAEAVSENLLGEPHIQLDNEEQGRAVS